MCAAFTIAPSPQVVGVGQQAVFRCRNPTATAIGWIWNGSDVMRANPPPGITLGSNSLTIMAQSDYNETEVVCVAFSSGGSMRTAPVNLLIQGPLSMIVRIKRNFSSITWEPSFSLNLTGVDPDIVYCVEVYNITCGVDNLVVGICNVTEPRYVDNRLQQGHLYRITITPRSNGEGAQSGSNSTKEERFVFLTDPRTVIMFASGLAKVSAAIQLKYDGTTVDGIEPASYFISLSSIDGTEVPPSNMLLATSLTQSPSTVTLNISQPLPRGRLWNYLILALGCHEHPLTTLYELSTHDFQNVTVNSSSPGEIDVFGNFISGSSAIGILAIVYSPNNDSSTHYQFIPRSDTIPKTTINGLPDGNYKVSIFVVKDNALPFNRSATVPRNISLSKSDSAQFFFEYELLPTSIGTICINCTFQDNSATGCVAVVHQRISQLSSSGLINIESSHKFNRSGDTANGCIEGVNLTDYQIGVFEVVEIMPTVPPSQGGGLDVGLIVSIVVVVVFLITILIFTTIVIICCKKRILSLIQAIREHCQQVKQKKSRDSSTIQRLTTDLSTTQTQEETAYDVLHRGKPPQVAAKEEGTFESAAEYSVLDKHPPQSGLIYSSIELGTASGALKHDDLHKTTTQYSTLNHQEPQEESSFDEGAAAAGGNADNRNADITHDDPTMGITDESVLNSFPIVQGPSVVAELTTLVVGERKPTIRGGDTTLKVTQCTVAFALTLDGRYTSIQGRRHIKEHLHPAMITRSCSARKEWQHKDLMLPSSYRLGQLRCFH